MSSQRLKSFLVVLSVLLITGVAYIPALDNHFVNWDDTILLTQNPNIRTLDAASLKTVWTGTYYQGYIPLTLFSFALEHYFFGYDPFIYHLTNIFLHLGVTFLMFVFARQIGLSVFASALSALIFGIHPMHVESVAWVSQRKDVLYVLFYMATLCVYWRYLQNNKRILFYTTMFLGLLSLLAKPMALTLPLILFLCDWLYRRKITRDVIIEKILHCLYIIPVTWITFSYYLDTGRSLTSESFLIAIWSFIFYLKKFLFPFTLVPLYTLPEPIMVTQYEYAFSIIAVFILGICLWRFRKRRLLLFAFGFYVLSIFFLIRFDRQAYIVVADRYMYLASIGFCFLLARAGEWSLSKIGQNQRFIGYGIGAILCCLLLFKTWTQASVWKNSLTLWDYVIAHTKNRSDAYLNRGQAHYANGRTDLAVSDFTEAIKLDPKSPQALISRANVHKKLGQNEEALADYQSAIEANPDFFGIYQARGLFYAKEGRPDLALKDFEAEISINPYSAISYINIGNIYLYTGEREKARRYYQKALELGFTGAQAYLDFLR